MSKIKVCGINDLSCLDSVQKFKPDYLGFITYQNSPRTRPNSKVHPRTDARNLVKLGRNVRAFPLCVRVHDIAYILRRGEEVWNSGNYSRLIPGF